jgi:C4-type Zn-finger protein
MNRQVVKSEFATVLIPELEFEIPPTTRNGNLTTVEGILQKIIDGLSSDQAVRKVRSLSSLSLFLSSLSLFLSLSFSLSLL